MLNCSQKVKGKFQITTVFSIVLIYHNLFQAGNLQEWIEITMQGQSNALS